MAVPKLLFLAKISQFSFSCIVPLVVSFLPKRQSSKCGLGAPCAQRFVSSISVVALDVSVLILDQYALTQFETLLRMAAITQPRFHDLVFFCHCLPY